MSKFGHQPSAEAPAVQPLWECILRPHEATTIGACLPCFFHAGSVLVHISAGFPYGGWECPDPADIAALAPTSQLPHRHVVVIVEETIHSDSYFGRYCRKCGRHLRKWTRLL